MVATGASGASSTYRVDVSHPLPVPAVAGLNATPGVLSPAFSPDTTNYTLTVDDSSVSAVSLSAQPMADCPDGLSNIQIQFTVDGQPVTGTDRVTIPLAEADVAVTADVHYIW